ncbi:hypothetical protein [Streptomyces sp. 147326]|uniref:hypothetical protein n=1 Tax=Streptomyces sp. 147326 TaxID=3074379 RepID=UPI003857719F
MILLSAATASAAASAGGVAYFGLGDNAQAGTAAQADAAADVLAPAAAPKAVVSDPARPASGGYALTASNRPYYDTRLLDLQRADGRATQVWTVQKVG